MLLGLISWGSHECGWLEKKKNSVVYVHPESNRYCCLELLKHLSIGWWYKTYKYKHYHPHFSYNVHNLHLMSCAGSISHHVHLCETVVAQSSACWCSFKHVTLQLSSDYSPCNTDYIKKTRKGHSCSVKLSFLFTLCEICSSSFPFVTLQCHKIEVNVSGMRLCVAFITFVK